MAATLHIREVSGNMLGGDPPASSARGFGGGLVTPSNRRLTNRSRGGGAGGGAGYPQHRSVIGSLRDDDGFASGGSSDRDVPESASLNNTTAGASGAFSVMIMPGAGDRRSPTTAGNNNVLAAVESLASDQGPTWKDHLAVVRHRLLQSPRFSMAVVVVTLLVLLAPVASPSVALSRPYFICEALLTLLFCCEVGLRLLLMRSSFWSSIINVAEAVMCFVCVLAFAAMCVLPPTKEEHIVVLGLRLVAQSLRGLTYCHQRRVMSGGDVRPLSLQA